MKKIIFASICALVLFSGCATWEAFKSDSANAWDKTKKATNEAYQDIK